MPSFLVRSLLGVLLVVSISSVAHARPPGPDWSKIAEAQTVQVISTEEDGGSRLTTVWIVVLDQQAYLRTGGTHWGDNVEREGKLTLRGPTGDIPMRAEKVLSAAEVARVEAAFREKYGTSDVLSGFVRFGELRIFHLLE